MNSFDLSQYGLAHKEIHRNVPPLEPKSYKAVRQRAVGYLNICPWLYCFDGFAAIRISRTVVGRPAS